VRLGDPADVRAIQLSDAGAQPGRVANVTSIMTRPKPPTGTPGQAAFLYAGPFP
jgi:hypothetical protein